MTPNIDKVTTFREVFNWIMWDLDDQYSLRMSSTGNFYVNKLYIERRPGEGDFLTYKCECAELGEGLFEKVGLLYEMLKD